LGIPGDFDVTQITWAPDYDPAFYKQLATLEAGACYLFRSEYIFEMQKAIVVETPEVGARKQYLFRKRTRLPHSCRVHQVPNKISAGTSQNIAEQTRFYLGGILHGQNPAHG